MEAIGEADLKLGADMQKGWENSLMTLFWFVEMSKPKKMQRDAAQAQTVVTNMVKL